MKSIKLILFTALIVLAINSVVNAQKAKPWDVPAKFKAMKNPVKSDDASINTGKTLYNKYCATCHGKTGLGDGAKAKGLDTFPGDFSKGDYQSQTDAEHFYKTKFGRDEMPKFDGKIDDESIWQVVNYMRTFKK
ncbi:MAG: cytochrome c [Bacteroidales bacterium]|nr:MAG: cytochrome c [Bacteroidales bacterium]